MDIETAQARKPGTGHLLDRDHGKAPVQAQAAISLRGGGVEHAQLTGTRPHLARHQVIFLPLLMEG
ncbi:hypothetical protein D3C85_1676700 [compost metagenome]